MILEGKKILIMGIRNKWSIAWGAALAAHENGAEVIFTHSSFEAADKVEKLIAEIPGAKGCPNEMLKEAGQRGVSKINVDTDLRLAMTAQVRRVFNEEPSVFDPRKYLGEARKEIKETVSDKINNVFCSANKA